jgi:glycosyltransferase involved in cell wall biosynthesis
VRIFHLVPNMNFGGLQEIVRQLCFCQRRAGHIVTIGCWTHTTNNPLSETQLRDAGVEVIYLCRGSNGKKIGGKKFLFQRLKKYLGPGNAEILHIHNPFFYYIYGSLAARAAGSTKVVETLHASVMFERRRKWRDVFWFASLFAHSVVSVCEELDRDIRRRFFLPKSKFAVVDNGIDLSRFLAVPPRPARGSEIVFGTAGRMASEKLQGLLLEAFAQLRVRHPNIRLKLLGGGELEGQLKKSCTALGLDDIVEFCGFSNDVPAFLSRLDVFVLPSLSEQTPLTVLEAMASGLPVVASAVGAIPRMIDIAQTGWLCSPGDLDALVSALEAAIQCANLAEMGEQARPKVAEYYTSERMAADYERLYRKLLD